MGLAVEDGICVTPETPVSTVDDQMRVNDWNAVFVKDGDDVVGLITRWDAGLKSYRDARSLTAGNIMTAAKFSDGVLTIVICQ